MPSRFKSAVLGSSIIYPNAVVWSDENLVAVACGNTVTILNPGNLGARGIITIPATKPFPLGVVDGEVTDLLNGRMLPCILARDNRPCARSISWSPMGLANNAGCLLAVCTTAGRVKLYRFPFCEFSAEWIEVLDISELLYNHFRSTSFGYSQVVSTEISDVIARRDNAEYGCTNDPHCRSRKKPKVKKQNAAIVAVADSDNLSETNSRQLVPASFYKSLEKVTDDQNLLSLTTQQYASHNEMLMSLVVAWSPILGKSAIGAASPHNSSGYCSILAVGGKCGRISFWRIHAPDCYSIDNPKYSSKVFLVGLLKAHDSWITTINWAVCCCNDARPQLLLVTGSSDGSVKIWRVNDEELLKSPEVLNSSFSIFKEAMTVDAATISVLSLSVPSQSPWKLFLAVGKGSGSIEVWIIDMDTSKFDRLGCYSGHDCIVTGLAWAFNGQCLYSCSQDNSMKSWILVENSLCEVPIPSYSPGLKSSCDVSSIFDSCFGLTVSPGNLAIAVAHGFDIDLLNPMYHGRTHRAAINFFWIGGQQLNLSSATCEDLKNESFLERELVWWERNILWSLDQYAEFYKLLNIWDVMAALLDFEQSSPGHTERILLKWLTSHLRLQFGSNVTALPELMKCLSKVSSRFLHLITIISRRVMLQGYIDYNTNGKQQELEGSGVDGQLNIWMELLSSSESELLERLVSFCYLTILSQKHNSSVGFSRVGCWSPDGLAQMEHWVSESGQNLKDQTKFLAAEVEKVEKRRLEGLFGYEMEELCNLCSAVVPFESREYAVCSGVSYYNGACPKHKLKRCASTMRILPTKPSWYCTCCHRQAAKLAPYILFTLLEYPSDFESLLESPYKNHSTPCCPFCGILLQRLQPEFSLSTCLV